MAKAKEVLCEVCGKPVDLLRDYADIIGDRAYSPREYIEHQLKMTPEEIEARTVFFTEQFERHNEERARSGNNDT